jgi:methionine synthase II (cobalamin-independent)
MSPGAPQVLRLKKTIPPRGMVSALSCAEGRANAGSFSFEAANPRHEHEYHLFERVKVPDGKVLCPGVVTHASNIVEHPEWIAESAHSLRQTRGARERYGRS